MVIRERLACVRPLPKRCGRPLDDLHVQLNFTRSNHRLSATVIGVWVEEQKFDAASVSLSTAI
jgi:hypothetical protein